jgi:hypothetical protein
MYVVCYGGILPLRALFSMPPFARMGGHKPAKWLSHIMTADDMTVNPCMPWPARAWRVRLQELFGTRLLLCSFVHSSARPCPCACSHCVHAVPAECPLSACAMPAACPLSVRVGHLSIIRLSVIHHACLLHRAATGASKDGHPWHPPHPFLLGN